jgi:hypothetical protein
MMFWALASYRSVGRGQRFGEIYCLLLQGLSNGAVVYRGLEEGKQEHRH